MALRDLVSRGERDELGAAPPTYRVQPGQSTVYPVTRIDASSQLEGKLRCKGPIRLEGRVKGEVLSEQGVIVAETAKLQASITAESIAIAGEVVGDLTATRKITLEKSARVTGDLRTPGIVIEEGAKLEGRIDIGSKQMEQPAQEAPALTPKAQAAKPAARPATAPRPSGPPPA